MSATHQGLGQSAPCWHDRQSSHGSVPCVWLVPSLQDTWEFFLQAPRPQSPLLHPWRIEIQTWRILSSSVPMPGLHWCDEPQSWCWGLSMQRAWPVEAKQVLCGLTGQRCVHPMIDLAVRRDTGLHIFWTHRQKIASQSYLFQYGNSLLKIPVCPEYVVQNDQSYRWVFSLGMGWLFRLQQKSSQIYWQTHL